MFKSIFRPGNESKDADIATKLLQTLSDSYSVDERREASSDLRDALLNDQKSKSTVSSFGLEVIANVVQNNWGEEDVVRNCLEVLAIIVDSSYSKNTAECRVNAEQLARTPGALSLLFNSLEYSEGSGSEHFHIKYFGLQVLRSLFEANRVFCQQASLKLPNSLSSPVRLLTDQEVLRNESILLLQSLVYRSKVGQNAALKSGCLDVAYNIYENEDPQINYAVIEDSMTLMRYILEENLDAQTIFCSSNKFENFLVHFQARISNANGKLNLEQSRIMASEIGIMFAFFASGSIPDAIKPILTKQQNEPCPLLITWLISLVQICGNLDDFTFSAAAWDCLLELSKFPSIQEDITNAEMIIQGKSVPIQLGALYVALTSRDIVHQMSSMRFCVRMLWRDKHMQDQCINQLFSSSNTVALLFGETNTVFDLLFRSRCLMCLAPLAMKKPNREKLLLINSNGKCLLSFCSALLSQTILSFAKSYETTEICLNCSIFAACMTQDSPEAISKFLQYISEKPFLVGVLLSESKFGDNESFIKGVCSLLLGLCLNAPETAGIDTKLIEDTIRDKIGLTNFMSHLNFLEGQTSEFDQDYLFNGVISSELFVTFTNKVKSKFYTNTIQISHKNITKIPTKSISNDQRIEKRGSNTTEDSSIPSVSKITDLEIENIFLKKKLQEHEEKLAMVQEKLRRTEEDLQALSHAYSALDEHSNNLTKKLEISQKSDDATNLDETAMEDLLVCLGQEEEKNARLVAQLEALGIAIDYV